MSEPDYEIAGDLTFESATGALLQIHRQEACTPPCPFHAPSDHHMVSWALHWRPDRGITERICPHGVGHPDPDTMAYLRVRIGEHKAYYEGIHGCDGCCLPD